MNLFEALVNESTDLLLVLNVDWRIVYTNSRCEKLLGVAVADCDGRAWLDFIHPDDKDRTAAELERLAAGEAPSDAFVIRMVSAIGSVKMIRWRLHPHRDPQGRVERIHGVGRETREPAERERSYRDRNERRMAMLLDLNRAAPRLTEPELCDRALDIAVEMTRSEVGYLHLVNEDQNTISLVSWNAATLAQCTAVHETHYPIDEAGIWADCARVKRPVVHNDYPSHPDRQGMPEGHFSILRHMSAPVLDGDRVRMVVGVGNKAEDYDDEDVKQLQIVANEIEKFIMRKRAEESLRHLNANLQDKIKEEVEHSLTQEKLLIQQSKLASMGEMIGVIVHQWKQPLHTINMFFEVVETLAQSQPFDIEAFRSLHRKVKQQIDHMNDTIRDFRDFFRPTKEKSHFYPCEMAIDVFKLVEAKMKSLGISLQVSDPKSFTCYGNTNEFKHVVLNIYSNALDALSARDLRDRNIYLSFEVRGSTGIIRVSDNGGGIPQTLLPDRLFDSYVTTKETEGTGVGLHIGKLIVEEKLHGRIWAHNVADGAEIVIELPISEPEQAAGG